MKSPSPRIVTEALVVSCIVCALPAALVSLGQRSPVSLFVFLVVAFVHGVLLGVPAYWFLTWRKAVNAFTCAIAGLVVGTLPYAVLFAPRMSGPGTNHVRTLLLLAVSGAAIGFVFWFHITKRMKNAADGAPRNERRPSASVRVAHSPRVGGSSPTPGLAGEDDAWYKRYKEQAAVSAKAKGLPDGVFSVVAYNRAHLTGWPKAPGPNAISPHEVFANEPAELVDMWVQRANKLLASNYPVGDALVGRYSTFALLKERFIAANPGFSKESYDYAIHLGAVAAR